MKRSSTKNMLTARETEVAALAALGLTCREIAERLLVSTNTVKTHLRHAYEKTGVRNRLELEHWLATDEPATKRELLQARRTQP